MAIRINRTRPLLSLALLAVIAAALAFGVPFDTGPHSRQPPVALEFLHAGNIVRVTFLGEVTSADLFGASNTLPIRPVGTGGLPEGAFHRPDPDWLRFEYSINGVTRAVLIAKQPVANLVSWDAVARAGAALGDGSAVLLDGREYPQDATVTGEQGTTYRVRLPTCGRSTMAPLSEWNLLIGAVHEGDVDFSGERYGWIPTPYSDADLEVGYHGSLSWCQELWKMGATQRVLRGYFFVSRFHAAESHLATDRIYWRPVLEPMNLAPANEQNTPRGEVSPDGRIRFLGQVPNAAIFGSGRITDQVSTRYGINVNGARPDWLSFELDGKPLLIAAAPVRHRLPWNSNAEVGAALGDGSTVRISGGDHVQNAEVIDVRGQRYRVRLLRCGTSTLDPNAEWNLLIGGVHEGDGDFRPGRDGQYGWIEAPLSDEDLYIGEHLGSASWCHERQTIDGKQHAVNRGYLTVSRFHLTEVDYLGSGFGWRPVLELVSGQSAAAEIRERQ